MLKTYPDLDLAAFYPEAVASDQWYGLSIGVGGEKAKEEAAKYRQE